MMDLNLDECTFDDVKGTIDMYIQRLGVLKAEIDHNEHVISTMESNESALKSAITSVTDGECKHKMAEILNEYQKTNEIEAKRWSLAEMYNERTKMINDIKGLFASLDIHVSTLSCSICIERQVDTFLKVCGHTFCAQCVAKTHQYKCPMCRMPFGYDDVKNLVYS